MIYLAFNKATRKFHAVLAVNGIITYDYGSLGIESAKDTIQNLIVTTLI